MQLEKETGITLSNSPTIHVGYEVVSELPKEEHEYPMLSLDKTKDVQTLSGLAGRSDGRSFLEDGRPDDCINL